MIKTVQDELRSCQAIGFVSCEDGMLRVSGEHGLDEVSRVIHSS